jgi:hypothetical protein
VEAHLVEVKPGRRGSATIRIKFVESCPFGFFNSATEQLRQDARRD